MFMDSASNMKSWRTLLLLATLSYSSDSNVTRTSNTKPVQSDSDLKEWHKVG